jgi:hypothetical protein
MLDLVPSEEYPNMNQRYVYRVHGIIFCVAVNRNVDFERFEELFVQPLLYVKALERFDPMVRCYSVFWASLTHQLTFFFFYVVQFSY